MSDNRNAERDAIFLAVVNSIRRDFPNSSMARQMTDEQAIATAASWADQLKHIPVNRVMGIYKTLAMSAKNPPVIADFAGTWGDIHKLEQGWEEDKKRQDEDEELRKQHAQGVGVIGAKVGQMNMQRWDAGLDSVCCDCVDKDGYGVVAGLTSDQEYFRCQNHVCQFRQPVSKLMEIRIHPTWRPAGNLSTGIPPAKPKTNAKPIEPAKSDLIDDDELIRQLESRCEMSCSVIGRERAVAFGKYLLERKPILMNWSRDAAKVLWGEFQEVHHARAA